MQKSIGSMGMGIFNTLHESLIFMGSISRYLNILFPWIRHGIRVWWVHIFCDRHAVPSWRSHPKFNKNTQLFGRQWSMNPVSYMGVSKNQGTPKSWILIGFSIIYHPLWGTPIVGNTHMSYSKNQSWFKESTYRWAWISQKMIEIQPPETSYLDLGAFLQFYPSPCQASSPCTTFFWFMAPTPTDHHGDVQVGSGRETVDPSEIRRSPPEIVSHRIHWKCIFTTFPRDPITLSDDDWGV